MNYNVFADFHHAGLLNSLIILFEDRLGGNLYRPIGKEWNYRGLWKIAEHPATVEQYLGIGGATPDETPKLNEAQQSINGVFLCQDIDSGKTNKAITMLRFFALDIDFVIASVPQHIHPYFKLCQEHPNKPKLIYQIGNAWNIPQDEEKYIDGVMASTILGRKPTVPYIEYHQEFDLDTFGYKKPKDFKKITSFVNCFNTASIFMFDWKLFERIERLMPGWEFKALGGSCRDGCAHGSGKVAEAMQKSRFIWHTKAGGDGYGHVIHNTGAVGRPAIVRKMYYHGKLAEKLMIDGKTCIAIDGLTDEEIVNKIEHYNEPKRYEKMCKVVYDNFKNVVDFDAEAKEIKKFLGEVKK